jgi:hypothetical protein
VRPSIAVDRLTFSFAFFTLEHRLTPSSRNRLPIQCNSTLGCSAAGPTSCVACVGPFTTDSGVTTCVSRCQVREAVDSTRECRACSELCYGGCTRPGDSTACTGMCSCASLFSGPRKCEMFVCEAFNILPLWRLCLCFHCLLLLCAIRHLCEPFELGSQRNCLSKRLWHINR